MQGGTGAPVVGRVREKARLQAAIADARCGVGSAILLRAAAGFGKSTLAAWAAEAASRHGCWTWSLRCEPGETLRPFGPFADALARDVRQGRAGADEVLQAVRHVPSEEVFAGLLPASVTDRILEYVEGSARGSGGLIVVEDVHYADPATRSVVRRLMRASRELSSVLLVTERTEAASDDRQSAEALLRPAADAVLDLGPLQDDEVAAIARGHGVEPTAELMQVLSAAAGQPLFVIELLGAWDAASPALSAQQGGPALPTDVQAVVLARVDELGPSVASFLRAAAVLGRRFAAQECAGILQRRVSELLPVIDRCTRQALIRTAADGRLEFRHDLIHEALSATLPATVAAGLHREAAAVLAEMGAPPERVATHLVEASADAATVDVMTLIDYARAVADTSPGAACDLFERALSLSPEPDVADEIAVELAELLTIVGRPARAEALARELVSRARPGSMATAARIALVRALFAQGRVGEVGALLDGLRHEQSAAGTRILGEAAFFMSSTGDLPGAMPYAAEALVHDRTEPDDVGAVAALVTMALAAGFSGDFVSSLETAQRAYERARSSGDRRTMRLAPAFVVANGMANLDRWDEAWRWLRQLSDDVSAYSITWAEPVVGFGRILFDWCTGAWDDALAECEAATAFIADTGMAVTEAMARVVPGLIRLERGDLAGAAAFAEQAAEAIRQRPASYGADWLPWLQARLAVATGNVADGEAAMQAVWSGLDAAGATWTLRAFGMDLVRELTGRGDQAAAAPYVRRLAELADTMTSPAAHATAARARALFAHDVDAAEEAVILAERSGRPLELAHAAEDAAAVLRVAGRVDRAEELLRSALAIAEQLQARATLDRVTSALARTGPRSAPQPRRVRPVSGWESLTPTEREVVRQVATGLSNREVASQLFISRYTVETHLKRIFTKLGVRTRTELAHHYARRMAEQQ